MIAKVETLYPDDNAKKNSIVQPTSVPDRATDYLVARYRSAKQQIQLFSEPKLFMWLVNCRLFAAGYGVPKPENEEEARALGATMTMVFKADLKEAERIIAAESAKGTPGMDAALAA